MSVRTAIKYNGTIISDVSEASDKILPTNGKLLNGDIEIISQTGSLPLGFQELSYIESTGTQWINSGINETDDTAIDLHLYNPNPSRNYLYGGKQWGSMLYNGLYNNNSLEYNWLTINYTEASDVIMTQTISGTTATIVINDTTFTKSTGTSKGESIYIFACNNDTVRIYTGFRLYYFKIKRSNTVMRNFIPCKCLISTIAYNGETQTTAESGTIGLFDLVSKTFFINAGTGTFVAGPEV